jgi:hypothetical protein
MRLTWTPCVAKHVMVQDSFAWKIPPELGAGLRSERGSYLLPNTTNEAVRSHMAEATTANLISAHPGPPPVSRIFETERGESLIHTEIPYIALSTPWDQGWGILRGTRSPDPFSSCPENLQPRGEFAPPPSLSHWVPTTRLL